MKSIFKTLFTLSLVFGLGIVANAQDTPPTNNVISKTAQASANIKAALVLELEQGTAIEFGILQATTPKVVLSPNGPNKNEYAGANTKVARFNLTGSGNSEVKVSYDSEVTLTSEGEDIIMTPIVVGSADQVNQSTASSILSGGSVLLGQEGQYFLWVGGSLPELTNAKAGNYLGTFNISVEYN